MSEHKTNESNWTVEQKKLYWERRLKNLTGQTGYANVHQSVLDDEGKPQQIPLGYRKPRKTKRHV